MPLYSAEHGDTLAVAAWLRENGHPHAVLLAFRQHLHDYPDGSGTAEAHLGAGSVLLELLHQPAQAYQYFVEALRSNPPADLAAAARAGMREIEGMQKPPGRPPAAVPLNGFRPRLIGGS